MNNIVTTLAPSFLIVSLLFLQATSKPIISRMGSKFGQIRPWTYNWRNVVTSLVLSNLNRSYAFLQIRRATIKAQMSLNFVNIPSSIKELAALDHLKN